MLGAIDLFIDFSGLQHSNNKVNGEQKLQCSVMGSEY